MRFQYDTIINIKSTKKAVINVQFSVCFSYLYSKTMTLRSEIEPELLKICEEEFEFKKFWGCVLVAKGNKYDSSWAIPCKRISYDPDIVTPASWVNQEIPNGAGGLYSTVYDIYKWHKGLNENLVMSEETRRLIETPSDSMMGVGYSVFSVEVLTNGKYHRLVYHDGATAGTSTRISKYTDDDIVVIVLSNLEKYDFAQLSHALAKAVITYVERASPPETIKTDL